MPSKFMQLDWEGAGYHGFPVVSGQDSYASADEAQAWVGFEQVLAAAKRGDFSGAKRLLAIYDEADWMLAAACAELMGDIGNQAFFTELSPAVTSVLDPSYSVDLGRSLAIGGYLSAVPTLLDTLDKIADFDDAPALVQMLSVMLEPEPGELGDLDALDDMPAYAAKVHQRADAIAARLGSDNAIVLLGDLFRVESLVDVMRQRLRAGVPFDPYLRHKFEATTGVDCSGFYDNGVIQPLQAIAILEEFEDLGDPKAFVPGRRYFFGYPVAD